MLLRITSRTWKCDPYLANVANRFVIKPDSITKRIQNSEYYRGRFQKNVRMQTYSPTTTTYIRSLGSANHRFDSHAKPFARGVVFFDALVITAQQLQDERRTRPEGTDAKLFLEQLDEEAALTFAALADAGAESLSLTRFFDDESFDKSKMAFEVTRFLERIKFLFVQKGCTRTGYFSLMLRNLTRAKTIFVGVSARQVPKTLGGPGRLTQDLIDRVLKRLQNWVVLATGVVQAEFTSFDALASFACFNLLHGGGQGGEGAMAEDLERLARLASVDAEELRLQFEDHFMIARRVAQSQKCTTLAAWQQAVQATQRSPKTAMSHPVNALVPALCRLGAYGGSTSGVERLFAKAHVTHAFCRADLSRNYVQDELDLITDINLAEDAEQVEHARKIWLDVYKTTRSHAVARCDKGVPKPKKSKAGMSLAELERHRNADVGRMCELEQHGDTGARRGAGAVRPCAGWSKAHEKELAFNKTKRAMALLDSWEDGSALAKEMTPNLREAARLRKIYDKKLAEDYVKSKGESAVVDFPEPGNLSQVCSHLLGKKFHVDSKVCIADQKAFNAAVRTLRLQKVNDRCTAEVFLVCDVNQLGQRTTWSLMLSGGFAINMECLLGGGQSGASLCFRPAIAAKRYVYATSGFKDLHPVLHAILNAKVRPSPACKWSWLDSRDELLEIGRTRARSNQSVAGVIAFVTAPEKRSEDSPPQQSAGALRADFEKTMM